MVQRSLSPARINTLNIDEDSKRISVFLDPEEVSKAIGKGGMNIRLASRMVDFEIDVYRDIDEDEVDIDLDEFSDEIESWMIDELKNIGCDTAKSVLGLSIDELIRRTDLEEESIKEIVAILKAEFEKD
jgi:N utilization substance protein A